MGFTRVRMWFFNPLDGQKGEEAEVLVDTGALFTALPRPFLERLGIKPVRRRQFRVFGGATVEREMGDIGVGYGTENTVIPVIFGEPGDEPILGVTALESLGYQVDPVTRELKRVDLLML